MNKYLVWLLLELMLYPLCAQNTKGVAPSEGVKPVILGKTWAVVVGISDYQNNEIPDLSYSHLDAKAFIDYLKSPSGGNVAESQIKALINEKATSAQFAAALDWLIDNSKEGDQAIIYFSGHGDVERKTFSQPGFLLCWDAPAKVYMGGGTFGLAYLQEVVSTLSSQNKSKVLVITDACHSGKLAGSEIGGSQATASNLAKQFANEIKLMSCQANELSLEGPQWGGGRGVFSYFLIKGLSGLADYNADGSVSLFEIERYLDDVIPKATAPKTQIPAAFGTKNTPIAIVDVNVLAELKKNEPTKIAESTTDKTKSNPAEETTPGSVFEKYLSFKYAIKEKHLLYPELNSAWNIYLELKDNSTIKSELSNMKSELAAALQDESQQAINDYLKSDPKELASRWKYDSKYGRYPEYLSKACIILGESHYLYKNIKAKEHYFTGLNMRLKGESSKDSNLLKSAIAEQLLTIKLDTFASYALNELGYLNKKLGNYSSAEKYLNLAKLYSPNWIMPWINEISLFNEMKNYSKAEEAGKNAIKLDSNSYLAYYNLSNTYVGMSNWINAEMELEKALKISNDDKDALYNLSFVKYKENKYSEVEEIVRKLMILNPKDYYLCIPLSCVYIMKGKTDEALKTIENAFISGFKDFNSLESEPDLNNLIKSSAYINLKKKYFSNQ